MTTAEWRSGATPGSTPPPPPDPGAAPQITSLSAADHATPLAAGDPPSFHPNGDGLDEELLVHHTVTRAAFLDATVTDSQGAAVRSYTVWSASGASTSRWDGRADDGRVVADGPYTLTYVPRDNAGGVGAPASTQALVLTAIALGKPSRAALLGADRDSLANSSAFTVTLNRQATVTWVVVDGDGNLARSVRSASTVPAGKLKFTWDGRTGDGAWAADGWYRSIVSASTSLGTYSQERQVYVGAFRVTPSIASPVRGGRLTLTVLSTEPLAANPTVTFDQPGVEFLVGDRQARAQEHLPGHG